MKIRRGDREEISEIVEVLKASLGEADLPLSNNIWNYKHVENPFGESIVYVAEEDDRLVGVRAFMRWEWQIGNTKYKALRAVDTATHPEFQGKGIFKKLTLTAVDGAKEQGNHFIFNTPNNQSRPGYLKMGWKEVGKISVGIKPALSSFWKLNKNNIENRLELKATDTEIEALCKEYNKKLENKEKIFTAKSREYLKWRYEICPLQAYNVMATSQFYLATYVKKRGKFKELRISECIYGNWEQESPAINSYIRKISKSVGAQVITFSPNMFRGGIDSINGYFGPVLTLKKLNLEVNSHEKLMEIKNWNNSIGDLEIF